MRPIDVDNLKARLRNSYKRRESALRTIGVSDEAKGIIDSLIDVIDEEPTIDLAKHGHWNRKYSAMATFVQCSNCGIYVRVAGAGIRKENERYLLYSDEMKFCPNCGAKMEYHPGANEGGDLGNDIR